MKVISLHKLISKEIKLKSWELAESQNGLTHGAYYCYEDLSYFIVFPYVVSMLMMK